ncbi:unnamed protein product [Rhizoctonia solani]|uniref:Nephrocystin 3-like N-terminal domain-containing protein n=1 Tax=Rhizoctonia solani TaxID=456999 RepID=A0A8H3DRP2_9AGAM|nr:unnamed protein product [Rhizoctonia solani]
MEGAIQEVREKLNRIIHCKNLDLTAANESDEHLVYYHQIGVLLFELKTSTDNALQNLCSEVLQPAQAASYNSPQSAELGRRPCERGSYIEVLDRLMDWGTSDESGLKTYWVNGMQRTGKTTIAYTICSELQSRKRLAASFFCSQLLPECQDVRRIIPTIAYQLAQFSHPFWSRLVQTLAGSSNIVDMQELTSQFQMLLKGPMMAIKDTLTYQPVIVIDALDELEDTSGVQTILKLLFEDITEMPVKFLILSRLDYNPLKPLVSGNSFYETNGTGFPEGSKVHLRVETGHLELAHRQPLRGLEECDGLFLYSASATRLNQPNHPRIDYQEQAAAPLMEEISYPHMDDLYIFSLNELFEDLARSAEELNSMKLMLWSAACVQESSEMTFVWLTRLLKLDPHNAEQPAVLISQLFQSLSYAPEGTGLLTAPPASFSDFLFSERSGEYSCDEPAHHGLLAQRCFELMKDSLQFNICGIESSLTGNDAVNDLGAKVNARISEELFYSCRYLGVHLKLSGPNPSESLIAHLDGFLTHQLLAWAEVLSLKQAVGFGISMLAAVEAWLNQNNILSNMIPLVCDARKFMASHAGIPVCSSTPHIYISLLSSWQPDSPMFQRYGNFIRDIVAVNGVSISYPSLYAYYNPEFLSTHNADSSRHSTRIPLNGDTKIPPQTKSIRLVMVSADNKSIISAAGRLAVSVWDRETGKGLSGPFYFRPACFGVVAFSADAKLIATTTTHREILIWDASTEKLVAGPFQGHQSWVAAVAFSPDGTRIVSGARDQLVMVWDIGAPSTPVRRFEGHTGFVLSVTFSPDGSRVVSASTDHTVRVWDVQNEDSAPLVLTGHTECVRSVDVSPDGTRVVSGADDHSVRIWDIATGQAIRGPLEGHSDYVLCVKFSPDGRQVVSGSQDCTVRVWDVDTGDVVAGPFVGHTNRVNTVTFSMDGTQVISGSDDGTIRVWNVQARAESQAQVECAPADAPATGNSDAWKLNPDGWVVDKDGGLLMWLPPLSHDAIRPPPADHMVIPRIELPMSSLLEGNAWKELCRRQEGKSIRYEISVPVSEGTST